MRGKHACEYIDSIHGVMNGAQVFDFLRNIQIVGQRGRIADMIWLLIAANVKRTKLGTFENTKTLIPNPIFDS